MNTDRKPAKHTQKASTGEAGRLSPELNELLHMLQSLELQFAPRT